MASIIAIGSFETTDAGLGPGVHAAMQIQPPTFVLLHDVGRVITTSRHQLLPRPPPASAAAAGDTVDYELLAGRRYRISLPADASGHVPEPLCSQWAGVPFRLRLEAVGGGACAFALALPVGAEPYGAAKDVLPFALNTLGFSHERFCFITGNSTPAPLDGEGASASPLRLVVQDASGRAPIWSARVRVTHAAPPSAAKKRGIEPDAGPEVPPRAPSSAPFVTDRDDGEDVEAYLVDAFEQLGRWRPFPDGLPPPTLVAAPAPEGADPPLLDVLEPEDAPPPPPPGVVPPLAPASTLVRRRLSARGVSPPMACPYRHGGDGPRAEAAALPRAARAAVRSAAAAAGLRHPIPAEASVPPGVLSACRDLAEVLSAPAVFDTDLFRTLPGRVELRGALGDLRLSGAADPVETVYGAWGTALAPGPHLGALTPEDAEFFCEHCWAVLEVALGPWFVAHGELGPLGLPAALALLDAAEAAAQAHVGSAPVLSARLDAKRAWALQVYGRGEEAVELYFRAWSTLIRAGATPSRLEARVLVELVESLSRISERFDVCRSLYAKLYWFDGDDPEDKCTQALVLRALAQDAYYFDNRRGALRLFGRSAEILRSLPEGYSLAADKLHIALAVSHFQSLDLSGVTKHLRRALAIMRDRRGYADWDLDFWWMPRIRAMVMATWPPAKHIFSMADFAQATSWLLLLLRRFRVVPPPLGPFIAGHMTYQLGVVHLHLGAHAKALRCLQRAKADLYDRYPAYFGPRVPRVANLAAAIETCRRALGDRDIRPSL